MSNASGDVRLHLNDGGIELKVGEKGCRCLLKGYDTTA